MTPISARFAHRLRVMIAVLPALLLAPNAVFAHQAVSACERWPEDRLIIGDLEGRRFDLEAAGPIEDVPRFNAAEDRIVLHRSFRLFLDAAEPIALFRSTAPKTLIVARDREKREPLLIPVFFVGRHLQSHADFLSDAELAAFAPSGRLQDGQEFGDVQFHLRSGGSRFSDIRPFLACGLAGLLMCEGTCPGDSALLAASLVNWKVNGFNGALRQEDETRFVPVREGCPPWPSPIRLCDPEMAGEPRGVERTPPEAGPRKADTAPQPFRPLPRLILDFETLSGTAIPVRDVLAAEGKISADGVFLNETAEGLGAVLPEGAVRKLKTIEALRHLFPHYRILKLRQEGARTVLVMEPLFVRAAQLRIALSDGGGKPVSGCELTLITEPSRQAGESWTANAGELSPGIKFRETGGTYRPALPSGLDENGLLILTSPQGKVARLISETAACGLEAKPDVTADELRSGIIRRSLRTTGAVFIALFSTDGDLSQTADPGAVQGFWSGALDLAGSLSGERWERKLLARAQAFGPVPETRILQRADGEAKLATGAVRDKILKVLVDGSQDQAPPKFLLNRKPLERFHLDLALEPLRDDAGLDPSESRKQESLLFITGGGGLQGSYFCRVPLPGGESWNTPGWVDQTRKLFAVEVWGADEAEALQKAGRATPAEGAPEGIYRCIAAGAKDGAIELYGLAPAALASSVRQAAFAYLTVRAQAFLKP